MSAERRRLEAGEVEVALRALPGWQVRDGKLHRAWRFADFVEAFGFMASAALFAHELDHHPEWSNVHATVTVDLVTHDARGITGLDVELARRMDALARRRGAAESPGS
jgi:4a-hydroxytetrahydrobiopterin dehydratase